VDIFSSLSEHDLWKEQAERRPVRRYRTERHHELNADSTVTPEDRAPGFEWMAAAWPDRSAAMDYVKIVHDADLKRAQVPPVVNVRLPGKDGRTLPGHLRVRDGQPEAYVVHESQPLPVLKAEPAPVGPNDDTTSFEIVQ
jgi:hypothetical protein